MKINKLYLAVITGCLGLTNTALYAQEELTAKEVTATEQEIEVIQVTTRRRVESLNKVPVMVSAFNSEMLEQQGIQSIDDIARFAPGLSFSNGFGRTVERPVIRGMSNILAGVQFGVESGAAYFIDGVYYAGSSQNIDMSDIARVEVIKGPQSALYGRNSYSGAINFITKGPDRHEFTGRVKASAAQHNEHNVQLYMSTPLTDTVAASLAVRDFSYGGEWTNQVTNETIGDQSSRSYTLVVNAEPTDAMNIRWRLQKAKDDDGTRAFFLQSAEMNNCAPGYRSLAYWPGSNSTNNNQYFCGEIKPGQIALNDGPSASGQPIEVPGVPINGPLQGGTSSAFFGNVYDLNAGTPFSGVWRDQLITSVAGDYLFESGYQIDAAISYRDDSYRAGSDGDHSSLNYTFAPGTKALLTDASRKETQDKSVEIQLRSPMADFEWMIGGFFYQQDEKVYELFFGNAREGIHTDTSDLTNKAIFGSVEYKFSDKLTASLEMRWSEEEKNLTQWDAATGVQKYQDSGTWDNFTPRLAVNYQWSDKTMLFGVLAQGVKPGGLNGAAGSAEGMPTYKQEDTDSFEVGIKTVLNKKVNLAASFFYNQINNMQMTTSAVNPNTATTLSIATNQGEGRVMGVELDAAVNFSERLIGRFSYALADTEFTKSCDDFMWTLTSGGGAFNDPANETGVDKTADFGLPGNPTCSVSGKEFPLTSKHQASMFFEYHNQVSSNIEGFVNFDTSYESKKYVQLYNLAYVPAATISSARIGIRAEEWSLTAYARNLFDEDSVVMATRWLQTPYFAGLSANSSPTDADKGPPRAFFGSPRRGRQVGVEFTYNF
ncbi:TonB-dependent receptor [Rheinheimera salexigens]|uniref:TonB-dependent receptor n=1 Tax=Rheinheimera salexigens TaxID=1628148 RepID=UPI000A6F43CE|nr:TonB-dependent receptor [Rheinheimera salexigens]